MSLCTIAELRSALGVGTLYPDATLQEVCDAGDAVLLPMLWRNEYFNSAHSNTATTGTLYFDEPHSIIVGEDVVITGNGSKHNGSKTVTASTAYSITYAITGNNNVPTGKHLVQPFGTVAADTYIDWSLDAAIQEAALMICVDIWQARQTTSSGGVAVDFAPSPWKMGSSLIARVRGLISHALSPQGMIG